jgi:hypothetical protein
MQQKIFNKFYSENYLKTLVFILIVYATIEKLILYAKFGAVYTDEDQCVLWLAADELMHGHFREPCFFGQAYNSCLEGWLSVPFLYLGLDFNQAIPLTTLLMSSVPFLLITYYFYREKKYLISIVILFCFLAFSMDYKLISILPRGFITGVFCFGLGYYFLLKKSKYSFLGFAFFAGFGFAFNEMSFFLTLPVLLTYAKENYKSKLFYLQGLLGLLPSLVYKLYAYYFYNIAHPEYNYFVKPKFEWDFLNLKNSISHIDDWWFNDFTMIFICLLSLLFILLYKKEYFKIIVTLTTFALVLFTLGLTRTQEGTDSIMFSKSRLFVFLPLLLAVLYSITLPVISFNFKKQLAIATALFLLLINICFNQQRSLNHKIDKEVANSNKIVSFLSVKDVYLLSYKYIYICQSTKNNLIIYDCTRKEDGILANTIPILSKNKIKTCVPAYDRRFWTFSPILSSQPEKILVSGNFEDRYDRESLKSYVRKIIVKDGDWLVEYHLKKDINKTLEEDFQLPIRIH